MRMCMCMYMYTYMYMYSMGICMYVCVYVCMYVCMYACMYVYIYIYIYIYCSAEAANAEDFSDQRTLGFYPPDGEFAATPRSQAADGCFPHRDSAA